MLKIIPEPHIVKIVDDKLFNTDFIKELSIFMPEEDDRIKSLLKRHFAEVEVNCSIKEIYRGYTFSVNINEPQIDERCLPKEVIDNNEAYYLKMDKNSAIVYSADVRGLFYGILTFIQVIEGHRSIPSFEICDWPDVKTRCMYFDMRQTFPKFENMLKYIETFAECKANTVIMEYEDKFPYDKRSELCSEEFAFKKEQIELIKKIAHDNFIEIIPLVQTFGHLEFVLKNDKYKHFREAEDDISTICPLNPDAFKVVTDLIDDMIELHADSRYIHIGCDEVWSICKCPECIRKFGRDPNKAFIYHVNRLIEYVAGKGKTPVIWHDMFEHFSAEEIELLDKRALVMVWMYNGDDIVDHAERMIMKLKAGSLNYAGAPSVCCHDRTDAQNYPVVTSRIENLDQWAEAAEKLNIDFMVATNWAIAGSAACPYGIYETSLYTVFYSAEKFWNGGADASSFLARFLAVFHGITDIENMGNGYDLKPDMYYSVIENFLGMAKKNPDIIEYISLIRKYEAAAFQVDRCSRYLFRMEYFKSCAAEKEAVAARYNNFRSEMESVRNLLGEKLSNFLPGSIQKFYMYSRYFIYDVLHEKVFDSLLNK